MSKKQIVIIAIIGFVVIVGVCIAILVFDRQHAQSSASPKAVPGNSQPHVATNPEVIMDLSSEDARRLEDALNSSDKNEQAKALVPELRDGEWSSSAVLPEGAVLAIKRDTFSLDNEGYASVDVVVSGSVEAEFRLGLMLVDGQWLIYTTEQKR